MHCPRSLTAAAWPAMCRLAWSLALLPSLQAQHGWVAETSNFRVVASERSGLDDVAVASAAEDLESVRQRCLLDGLGTPRRLDGRLEVLLVGTMLELHSLLRDPPDSRTRGITIRGLDQAFVVVPWRALPGPRVTLAHEYSHQLDDPAWPLWFKEGRAVYLGRRMLPRSGTDPLLGLLAMLDRSEWLDWSKLLEADRESAMAKAKTFQAQSWLLVHWLVSSGRSIARLLPDDVGAVLDHHGPAGLTDALRGYLASLWDAPPAPAEPVPALAPITVRPAVNWEVPLFEAEILRALRFLDAAEPQLADLAERFRSEGRVQAAYASLLLLRNRQDEAEQRYRTALNLGDPRSRSAYRYALLLMRPGPAHATRAARAVDYASRARAGMPEEPTHHLAVAQARMLVGDWDGAYDALRGLVRFPGWARKAKREADEVERRRSQAVRAMPAPEIAVQMPSARVPVDAFPRPPAWKQRATVRVPEQPARRWPPYGTWLAHGKIAWVDCSGEHKKVVLHTPYSRLVLRENPDQPPRLIHRPFRARTLPCESRGWQAAVAYRRLPHEDGVDGELVGIRF